MKVFDDLASALADLNFVFATTARQRDGFKSVRGRWKRAGCFEPVTIWGSAPASCSAASASVSTMTRLALPTRLSPSRSILIFSSLNIAQAALLMSYEWMKSGLEDETKTNFAGPDMKPASKEELHGLFAYLEGALEARGYFRPAPRRSRRWSTICAPC